MSGCRATCDGSVRSGAPCLGPARWARGRLKMVTLGCLIELVEQELAELGSGAVEHTVTAMPFQGLAVFLDVAAQTVLPDAGSARDYLTRLRAAARGSTSRRSGFAPVRTRAACRGRRWSTRRSPGPRECSGHPRWKRWRLRELGPRARPAERAGLTYLPDGDADYQRAVRSHTTLALGPPFLLPEFHAALLDSGSPPVPVLHQHMDRWAEPLGLNAVP